MPLKNPVSWNSIIAAFAGHSDGLKTLQLFEEMRLQGAEPVDVTFLSLLHARSHVGLVEKGMEFLESMSTFMSKDGALACVVDMYGRAGCLKEAKSFNDSLPAKPDILVWQALLGACSICGDTEMGKYAAEQLHSLAPENLVSYTSMAEHILFCTEMIEPSTIKRTKEMGLKKDMAIVSHGPGHGSSAKTSFHIEQHASLDNVSIKVSSSLILSRKLVSPPYMQAWDGKKENKENCTVYIL
ncbi:LOW QUALITY PROTEIN: Pentatricopeptide repeat [Dillenia turbinata]|uniref:Pentatricopeptide repeat n=1 Tax=Dillenia turbinata TaxID=194707 RepID=A0AAN8UJA6_9MAGN